MLGLTLGIYPLMDVHTAVEHIHSETVSRNMLMIWFHWLLGQFTLTDNSYTSSKNHPDNLDTVSRTRDKQKREGGCWLKKYSSEQLWKYQRTDPDWLNSSSRLKME